MTLRSRSGSSLMIPSTPTSFTYSIVGTSSTVQTTTLMPAACDCSTRASVVNGRVGRLGQPHPAAALPHPGPGPRQSTILTVTAPTRDRSGQN